MSNPILEAKDLTVQYETRQGMLTAVSDVSFTIEEGQYFGIVGESGCGKSTLAKSIIGALDENGQVTAGKLLYRGTEIQHMSEQELNKQIRWKEISYIPQASMNSLDPLRRLDDQALELAQIHTDLTEEEARERFRELFDTVGLQPSRISDYPHQFSGGMQQRAIIALALFLNPSVIIADEPTTALDVIMQDQVFKYLRGLREEVDTTLILITHDISLVFETCDRLMVMHGGQLAELGTVVDVYDSPKHPYSYLLQQSFPDIRYPDERLETIEGKPPQQMGDINYCTFADRCPWSVEECRTATPPTEPVEPNPDQHVAACIRSDEIFESGEPTTDQPQVEHDD